MSFMKKILFFLAMCMAVSCRSGNGIVVDTRPEINYVTHLYTLAGLGFEDAEYVSSYGSAVSLEDLDILRSCSDYLIQGRGQGGGLAGCFFFGVAAQNLSDGSALKEYLDSELSGMDAPDEVLDAFRRAESVYVSNYDSYLSDVYPRVKKELQERIDMLNSRLKGNTIVSDWENVTGLKWKYGTYTFLLYRAGADGPSYNNLNKNTNTLYFNQDTEYTMSMFSHEFGIFLMMEDVMDAYGKMAALCSYSVSSRDLTYVPWSAFESLSCWYGSRIAGEKTVDYYNFQEADAAAFYEIYDSLYLAGVTSVPQLYKKAVKAYIDPLVERVDEEHHITTSDGVDLYVHVRGYGLPCLYLHGGPGSGSEWMEKMGGDTLEKYFTMVYLDQRGVCKSSTPSDMNFSFDRQVQDFEEVREALGYDRWILLGHSFGGVLQMGYWERHPDCIAGMVCENCTICLEASFKESWLPAAVEIAGGVTDAEVTDTTLRTLDRMAAVQKYINNDNRWMIFTRNKWANDTIASWSFHQNCISHGHGEDVLLMDEYWRDFRPLSAEVNVPVLFLYGRYDRAVGPEFYKGVRFPEMMLVGADCGHIFFLEEPELLSRSLGEFVERYF